MSKGIYVGVDNVARKVKKAFVGVDDKARKVKKAYIGVGGIARPFFSSEPGVSYYGTVGQLEGDTYGKGANLPDYALFLNVVWNPGDIEDNTAIHSYDADLTQKTFNRPFQLDSVASVGDYALFAQWNDVSFAVDGIPTGDRDTFVLDSNLVEGTAAKLTYGLVNRSAESNGKFAIFYGGYWGNGYSSSIEAFDASLTKTSMRMSGYEDDADGYDGAASARNGQYAIFAGGEPAYDCPVVAIDENLRQTIMSPLEDGEHARWEVSAVTVGTYTLFIGGVIEKLEDASNPYPSVDFVDVYDDTLVKLTVSSIDVARSASGAAELNGIALVAGGYVDGPEDEKGQVKVVSTPTVLTFTEDLVQGVAPDLVTSRGGYTAVETIGPYAIVVSENPPDIYHAQTDVYTVL